MATNTPTLGLETDDFASYPAAYWSRVERDRVDNANSARKDAFAAQVTASFTSIFSMSGSVSTMLAHSPGSEYAKTARIITDVMAYAEQSGVNGPTGVTRIDIQRQQDGVGAAFVSIYSNNTFKPALSTSLGNYVPAFGGTISGTIWPAGTVLKAVFDTAAASMANVQIQVFWKPSGSYGA